jgi:hypothetical protein
MVFPSEYYCEKCGDQYTSIKDKWCKPCLINELKKNFTNWTSKNKEIDNLIQEAQLIADTDNIVFEWIPYSQFSRIKEMEKRDLDDVYSAIWKNGPLYYSNYKYIRERNKTVTLKCLNNSQNTINEFLNEV